MTDRQCQMCGTDLEGCAKIQRVCDACLEDLEEEAEQQEHDNWFEENRKNIEILFEIPIHPRDKAGMILENHCQDDDVPLQTRIEDLEWIIGYCKERISELHGKREQDDDRH